MYVYSSRQEKRHKKRQTETTERTPRTRTGPNGIMIIKEPRCADETTRQADRKKKNRRLVRLLIARRGDKITQKRGHAMKGHSAFHSYNK